MTETLSFGYWVRRRRKALDLTQAELAARVCCAEVTIRRIEADERRPSRQIAALLADQLQLDPAERPAFLQAARAELAADRLELATEPRNLPAPEAAPVTVPSLPAPSGTITFLFTDIEGSTRLWEQHPEAMPIALGRHDTLLRQAVLAHGGTVFKTVGDSVCAAFATAPAALAAALEAQRALQAEVWQEIDGLPVRMALHTGTVEAREGDYFGPPLNRVARLLSAGHGGQVLLSAASWELVRDQLPLEVALRDLGMHRLKDLTRPEQIFQLVTPDLPSEFPPLKTLDLRRTNLPVQPTPLIGREQEVAAVCDLLRREDVRLVTLIGPGGVGKTRLALQAAAELLDSDSPPLLPQRERGSGGEGRRLSGGEGGFPDGVYFVALAPITDPAFVPSAIAQPLGIQESGSQPLVERLQEYLRDKRLLLILDNFEQLLQDASLIAAQLAAAPGLKVLITSRAVLHLSGEHAFPVPPLGLPDRKQLPSVEQLSQYDAVALFIARARAARPDFHVIDDNAPAMAAICSRLDGLPLAIELAAARCAVLSPQALLARLDQRLKLLTGGARDLPARQQTLRSTIAWSYDLLCAAEQTLFRRLAVFVGGCTLEAVEAVCNAAGDMALEVLDGLTSLVEKSLLRQEEMEDGEPRFVMLETIREYALERLAASGETDAIQRSHAAYYLALAERLEPELRGSQQKSALEQLEAEHDNLRAALNWSHATEDGVAIKLRLASALAWFWCIHGHLSEGRTWLERALAEPGAAAPTRLRASALNAVGLLALGQGDLEQASAHYEQSREVCHELADQRGLAETLLGLGRVAELDDNERATVLYEESLEMFRALGDTHSSADALTGLGLMSYVRGEIEKARLLLEDSLTLYRNLGDKRSCAECLMLLGNMAHFQSDYSRATLLLEEGLALAREIGYKYGIALALHTLGSIAREQGDSARASALFEQDLAIARDIGDKGAQSDTLKCLGEVAYNRGDYVHAMAWFQEARTQAREGSANTAFVLFNLGRVAHAQGDDAQALALLQQSVSQLRAAGNKWGLVWTLHELGAVAHTRGDDAQARALLQEGLRLQQQLGARWHIAQSLERFAGLAAGQGNAMRAVRLFGAAEALREAIGTPLQVGERVDYDRDLASARAQLNDATFAAAWAEGRRPQRRYNIIHHSNDE